MKNGVWPFVVLLNLLIGCNVGKVNQNIEKDQSFKILDDLIGKRFDTSFLCVSSLNQKDTTRKFFLSQSYSHSLIFYFGESMCSSCIQDAFKFIQEDLKFLPSGQIKIVTQYTNVRSPAVLCKLSNFHYPFCNVFEVPQEFRQLVLDKPLFLVVDPQSKIINLFQLKDTMVEKIRASINILTN